MINSENVTNIDNYRVGFVSGLEVTINNPTKVSLYGDDVVVYETTTDEVVSAIRTNITYVVATPKEGMTVVI